MKKKDGTYIWIHDTGCCIETEDGREGRMAVCMDITEDKKREQKEKELYEKELSYLRFFPSLRAALRAASTSLRTGWRAVS